MAIKKKFPYRSAFVACNGNYLSTRICPNCCFGCGTCVSVCKFGAISLNSNGVLWWMRKSVLPAASA